MGGERKIKSVAIIGAGAAGKPHPPCLLDST